MPDPVTLDRLFHDPAMFDSPSHWRRTGFEVEGEGLPSSIMVASHTLTPGGLFKKYSKSVPLKKQRDNYRRRIKGANKLRDFITDQQLSRFVVPQKHLYALTPVFSYKGAPAYVLVVEKLLLLNSAASKQQYLELDNEGLRQLCTVLRAFEGLDSGVRNIPFTANGQIAFIDTERWDEKKEVPLHHVRKYLSDKQRRFTERLF